MGIIRALRRLAAVVADDEPWDVEADDDGDVA